MPVRSVHLVRFTSHFTDRYLWCCSFVVSSSFCFSLLRNFTLWMCQFLFFLLKCRMCHFVVINNSDLYWSRFKSFKVSQIGFVLTSPPSSSASFSKRLRISSLQFALGSDSQVFIIGIDKCMYSYIY